jgi:hypothetical protein
VIAFIIPGVAEYGSFDLKLLIVVNFPGPGSLGKHRYRSERPSDLLGGIQLIQEPSEQGVDFK